MTIKSQFKLDPRIRDVNDIQTCIKYDDCYIGHKGYFFDHYAQVEDLNKPYNSTYGTLLSITPYDVYAHPDDSYTRCFKAEIKTKTLGTITGNFEYFIPEYLLKPEEPKKKYRPYNMSEFKSEFKINSVLTLRKRKEPDYVYQTVYLGNRHYDDTDSDENHIYLSQGAFSLRELFNIFEIVRNGDWEPFGVIDEQS